MGGAALDRTKDAIDTLAEAEEAAITRVTLDAASAINKSEVEAQLDAAHKYPRSITRFLKDAASLATITVEVAESCIYALPRDGKTISGPSVRLAEIAASAYGNIHAGSRVLDAGDKDISAQGIAWDLERNLRITVEVRRRIVSKNGRRYSDDMITMTGNAAGSIAFRNAIFRVIPRAYINMLYDRVRKVAVGDAMTLAARRGEVIDRLQKMGAPLDRILAKVEARGAEDIGLEQLEVLIGIGTAIKNGDATVDEMFAPPAPAPVEAAKDGKRIALRPEQQQQAAEEPPKDGAEQQEGQGSIPGTDEPRGKRSR